MPPLGFEYLTSNQYTAYPFKEDALGLARGDVAPVHGVNALLPLDFLLDAVIYLPVSKGVQPVLLRSIVKSGDNWLLTFALETDEVLTTLSYTTTPDKVIGLQTDFVTIRLLKGDSFDTWLQGLTDDQFGTTLPFESCVVEPRLNKVDALFPCDSAGVPKIDVPVTGLTADVQFVPGYNILMAVTPDTAADVSEVSMAAVPGAGAGFAPSEVQPTPVVLPKPPMGLIPDKFGNVRFDTDDCYEVIPIGEDTLSIQGSCYNCCTCDAYVAVATRLKDLLHAASVVNEKLQDLTVAYREALLEFKTVYLKNTRRMYLYGRAIRGVQIDKTGSYASNMGAVHIRAICRSIVGASNIVVAVTLAPAAQVVSGSWTLKKDDNDAEYTSGQCDWLCSIPEMKPGNTLVIALMVKATNPIDKMTAFRVDVTYTDDTFGGFGYVACNGPFEGKV